MICWCIFDILGKEKETTQLEIESSRPEFWQDQIDAQKVMRRLSQIKEAITVGHMVEKGAMSAMCKFAEGVWDMPAEDISACCPDENSTCADGCCT